MGDARLERGAAARELAGLGAGYDRVAAAMYGIDTHQGLGFLRAGGLSGATARLWSLLRPELDALWAQFSLLGDLLERARAALDSRTAESTLASLLRDPVIALDASGMPVDTGSGPATDPGPAGGRAGTGPGTGPGIARGTGTGGGPVASRLSLADLARLLESRCGSVGGALSDVESAWSVIGGRLAPLIECLDALAAGAADLGMPSALEPAERELARAREQYLGDPLTAAPGGRLTGATTARLDAIGKLLDAERARFAELERLRDGLPARLASIGDRLDELTAVEDAARASYARAAEKIARPGLPPAPDAAQVLRGRLAALDERRRDGRWSDLADNLSTLESSVRRATARAGELSAAADGLLRRRDELRGRLEAYRAKAARLGFAEHAELGTVHSSARTLLYTAPCDLRAATRAVFAYQTLLADLVRAGGGSDPA